MRVRRPYLLAFLVAGLLAVGPPTVAAEHDESGRCEAAGRGKVVLQGHVVAFGLARGRSRIVVVDRRGDATLSVDGRTRMQSLDRPKRWRKVVIPRAEGRFYVRGSRVSVVVQSRRLSVAIAGTGRLRMKGQGRYSLNGAAARNWSRDPRRWRSVRLRGGAKR